MEFSIFDEADLPASGMTEDIDGINALLAAEGIDIPDAPVEEAEDDFLEGAFEDLSDPYGQLD